MTENIVESSRQKYTMMRSSFLVNNSKGDIKIIAKILDNGDLSKGREDDPSHEHFVHVAPSTLYLQFSFPSSDRASKMFPVFLPNSEILRELILIYPKYYKGLICNFNYFINLTSCRIFLLSLWSNYWINCELSSKYIHRLIHMDIFTGNYKEEISKLSFSSLWIEFHVFSKQLSCLRRYKWMKWVLCLGWWFWSLWFTLTLLNVTELFKSAD